MAQKAKEWLAQATLMLKEVGIESARLDAELMLADAFGQPRTWLLAHSDEPIADTILKEADLALRQRASRVPLAYIRGWSEFYGRIFNVNRAVLIPRPETEELIDLIKSLPLEKAAYCVDIGTGSGCIGITLSLELPNTLWDVSDVDTGALAVAQENAYALNSRVRLITSHLLETMTGAYDLIVANLPYVEDGFDVSPEVHHEPDKALYAKDHGYGLINQLIDQSTSKLRTGGYLALEMDPWQKPAVIKKAARLGFCLISERPFHVVLQLRNYTAGA